MYIGPPIDDREMLERLPSDFRTFLEHTNGYVAYHGGLHVRGACLQPEWHSLRAAWTGESALYRLFAAVESTDIPFAEDALGDQFLLRGGLVHRLAAESGTIESLGLDLIGFDQRTRDDPTEFLMLGPLEEFRARGGTLLPGQLLSVYPPLVMKESAVNRSYSVIPAGERRRGLAELAAQIRNLKDGTKIRLKVVP